MKYQTIFRHKSMGKRIGALGTIVPGDYVTYCTVAGFYTREVGRVNETTLRTEPLMYKNHKLDGAHTIKFEDIREILRPVGEPESEKDKPEKEPPKKTKGKTPAKKTKKKAKRKTKRKTPAKKTKGRPER